MSPTHSLTRLRSRWATEPSVGSAVVAELLVPFFEEGTDPGLRVRLAKLLLLLDQTQYERDRAEEAGKAMGGGGGGQWGGSKLRSRQRQGRRAMSGNGPVYILGIVPSIDNPSADTSAVSADRSPLTGSLSDLAAWTGGHTFVASTPGQRSLAARQIVDELRHQYLIAFESSSIPGWHQLEVRARSKDLIVRARSGYIAGQSRPSF